MEAVVLTKPTGFFYAPVCRGRHGFLRALIKAAMHKTSGPILRKTKPQPGQFSYKLWLDSFAAYPYSCRSHPLEFFIVFKLQTVIKKCPAGKCDDYRRKLQINRPICKLYKLSPGWHSDIIQSKSRRNRKIDYN